MATQRECSCSGTRSCLSCERNRLPSNVSSENVQLGDVTRFYLCLTCRSVVRSGIDCLHEDDNLCDYNIDGLNVFQDFISETEEKDLVKEIDKMYWKPSQSGRRKQDYGPQVNFKRKKVKLTYFNGLPEFSQFLIERMHKNVSILSDFQAVELCNLDYLPERGASIDPHFDDFWLWGERLVTINLLSSTVITMSNEAIGVAIDVQLPRRSLIIMSGPARHKWKHGIHRENITSRRIAITLRELSDEFLNGGLNERLGREIHETALSFRGNSVQVNKDSLCETTTLNE